MRGGGFEGVDGSWGGFSNSGLELGEGILDGIEIGTVGRQVEQLCPACFDRPADARDLVGGQIVHDDDVTRAQGRRQHLLAPGSEDLAVHRPVEQHRGDEAGRRQAVLDVYLGEPEPA